MLQSIFSRNVRAGSSMFLENYRIKTPVKLYLRKSQIKRLVKILILRSFTSSFPYSVIDPSHRDLLLDDFLPCFMKSVKRHEQS